ncbi:MAG: hypothetical protein GHCLOJNM_01015 [bacterium]|nr:hypothetical protein [bacterium]
MIRLARRHAREGFTLLELLIVVAIILILIAIALPNFIEARIRAKVARAEADMRTLAVAVESYYQDRRIYPYPSVASLDATHLTDGLRLLTTPISYLTDLPTDPFSLPVEGSVALHFRGPNYKLVSTTPLPIGLPRTNNVDAYFLYSYGPNLDDESTYGGQFWPFSQLDNPCAYLNSTNLKSYSPTNGTKSAGDILRFGGEYRAGNWCLDGIIIRGRKPGG